jgi:DNA-binding MarR family transcriptional regulator
MPSVVSREERIRLIKDVFHYLTWVAMRQFSQLLQPFGLTAPQYFVLAALSAHHQACTMRDLISVAFEDPPTMTGIIDRLVKMSLVERTRSDADRRLVLVQSTPIGVDLVHQIQEQMVKNTLTGYTGLSDDELLELEQLLTYKLRMYLQRYKTIEHTDLEVEMDKIRQFMRDPIHYSKLENEKGASPHHIPLKE